LIGLHRLVFWPLVGMVLLVSGAGSALAFSSVGAEPFEHPEGISLRQESVGLVPGAFFLFYGRTHRRHTGGGLHGGK